MAKKKTVTGRRGISGRSGAGNKSGRRAGKPVELMASAEESKRSLFHREAHKFGLFRPFETGNASSGHRRDCVVQERWEALQNCINIALRKVMEREIKNR